MPQTLAKSYAPYIYECYGCGKKNTYYVGTIHMEEEGVTVGGFVYQLKRTQHCCSEKCLNFGILKADHVISSFYHKREEYVEYT